MSLMNDMLRDLDKRQAPDRNEQVDAQSYGALTQKAPSHGSRTVLILLSVIIIMLLTLAIVWWYLQISVQDDAQEEGRVQQIAEFAKEVNIPDEKPSVIITNAVAEPKQTPVIIQTASKEEEPATKTVGIEDPRPIDIEEKAPVAAFIVNVPEAPKVQPKAKPALIVNPKKEISKTAVLSKVLVLSPEQKDEKAASLATKMLQSGESEKASAYLYQFIDRHSVDAQSRAVLVSHLINNRQMTAADYLLNNTDISQSSHLRRLRAHWFSANGQLGEALTVLNSAVPDVEADVEYHVLLAALYQQQGYGAEAVARYAELLRYNPGMPDWWVGMAIGLDSSEQYSSAAKAYQKALQLGGLKTELAAFAKQRIATLNE